MKTVLIASGSGWHVRDLLRAASCLDLEVEVVSFLELEARLGVGDQNSPSSPSGIRARGLELGQADRVLVRTMPAGSLEQIVFRMDALHWLQSAGVPVFNSTRALETAIDKYLSLSRLAAAGLPVPATVTCEHAQSALEAFDTLGGDVVTKPLFGSEGRDLLRIERRCDAETSRLPTRSSTNSSSSITRAGTYEFWCSAIRSPAPWNAASTTAG